MAEALLNLEIREHTGKKWALRSVVFSKANLIDLKFPNDRSEKCVIREVQWDPLTSQPLHVDLMGIKLTEKITVKVSVRLVGSPAGVKEGGTLQTMLRELE